MQEYNGSRLRGFGEPQNLNNAAGEVAGGSDAKNS